MKQKMLSLFLALSMLMPLIGAFPIVSSAENKDDDTYGNPMSDWTENTDEDIYDDLDDIVISEQMEEASRNQGGGYETTVAYADSSILTIEQYDEQLNAIAVQLGSADPIVLTDNEDYVNILLRRKLVEKTGYETLAAKMNEDADFAACMEWLFTDIQMLHYYSYGGEPEANGYNQWYKKANSATYMSSFDVLTKIYTKHKEDMNDTENAPLYKRMMAAIALTHSVAIMDWPCFSPYGRRYKWKHYSEPVGRYELYKKFYGFGFLADEFDKYNVEEMRMVMHAPTSNEQLEWMQHYYRVKTLKNPDYAERVVATSPRNVGGAPVRYATTDKDAVAPGSKPCFDPDMYDHWNEKYMLSVHDEYFDFDVDYGLNELGQYYSPQWLLLERGGVCVDISLTGCIVRNSFGLAARYLCQAPWHMSYLTYNYNDGKPVCASAYNMLGIQRSDFKEYGYSHVPAGWTNFEYHDRNNAGYMFLGIDAMYNNHGTNFEKAENIAYLAEIQTGRGNYEEALEIYEKVLEVQYFHLGAYVNIGRLYEKLEKTEDDYYALAERAAEALKWYPLPMYEYIIRFISPKIDDIIKKADLIGFVDETLSVSATANAENSGLFQPSQSVEGAGYCKTLLTKIATFSFDTEEITLNSAFRNTGKDLLYSFDKGVTWNRWKYEEGVYSHKLTPEEVAQITDANDIYYTFDTAKYTYIIPISTNAMPPTNNSTNRPNDDEDVFINVQKGLEYSTDEGQTWHDLTSQSVFEGEVTVWVRKKATGAYLAGPHFVANFTVADDTPERRYLRLSGNVKLSQCLSEISTYPAKNAIDTKKETWWTNLYAGANADSNYDNIQFIFEINEPHYMSAIGYIPKLRNPSENDGTITGCEVWISNDKTNWTLAGSTNSWGYVKSPSDDYPREQFIDFDEPAYTKYVKIKVTKAGTTTNPFGGATVVYATAAEFKLYENEVCPQKEVDELNLTVAPEKTKYKIGDRLDLDSITARLLYNDGTTSIIPASELEYSEDVFDSTDTTEVNASYEGAETSFAVSVTENDRAATAISSVTISDRKYYGGDEFDKANALVQVTDGTNKWYLLPNEFEFENSALVEGKNTLTVVHKGLSSKFTVNAEKAVKEMRIDTDESFKTQYFIGDDMDLSGMSVHLVYTDGTEKVMDASEYNMELFKDGDVPITSDIFARTAGTKTIKVSLKDKEEINSTLDVTVFSYITVGEFAFEALPGETACKMTGFIPAGDKDYGTIDIPETVIVGGYEYKVKEIADGAFSNIPEIEAVSIPKSVETIYEGAFSSCTKLEKVYMTDYKSFDGFTCEDGAFADVQNGYVYLHHTLINSESPIKGYTVAGIAQEATSIIVTPPEKTEYILGEEFDKTGMVVTAILPDGSKVNTNAYSMRGYYSTITGEQTITITLDGSKLKQTFTVNVDFPKVTIEKSPTGGTYAAGSEMEPIKVIASAENSNALSYQWYRSETEEKNGTAITGATKAEYIPTRDGYYYAAVYVKDKNNKMSEKVYSDFAHIMTGDYAAIIGTNGYDTLKEAIDNAPENSTIRICKDIEINETIAASGKKFTIDGQGHTLSRSETFKKSFILMTEKTVMTLKDIIFDGGTVWTGEKDPIVKRGLTNSGLTSTSPFVLAYEGTELIIADGAIMQNNYNTGTIGNNAGQILDDNLTGGAVWAIDATITMDGGTIRNNASTMFGSAMYVRGNNASVINIYDGEISGNHDPNPNDGSNASAICADNKTSVNVNGGTFINNKGGKQGGVFWIGIETLIISGGLFENNYSYEYGGVVYFNQGGKTINLTAKDAIFRNNRAEKDGGALFCGNSARISSCEFENNIAGGNGGALWIRKEGLTLSGNKFNRNRAVNGGAIYSENNITTSNDNFVGNIAEKGNGIYMGGQRQLAIQNIGTAQDIYLQNIKPIKMTGMANRNKLLEIITESEITNDTEIIYTSYDDPMDIRVNGHKTEYKKGENGKPVYENGKGYVLKVVIAPRVVYNKDGGTIDNEWQYTIYNTGTPLTLPTPHKDGYNFAGWFDNAELTGTAVTEIGASETEDKTFWAKWNVAEYSVTLNVNGGTMADTLSKYTYGEGAALPVPEKSGYNFAGWFDNAECEGAVITEITDKDFGNKEYWAKWAENGYSVTLNTNGGTLAENLTEYTYGEGAVLPVPTRDNYTFEGWFDNADCEGTAITEIGAKEMGNKAYWAKWKTNEYVIRFVNYNNRLLQQTNVEFGKHPEYMGAVPEKDAEDKYTYTFAGWSPEITSVTGDTTYTAQFNAVPRVYSLMLNLDEGILDNEEAYMEYTCGTGVALPTPYKDDFYFVGWYDNEDYSGEPVNVITADDFGDKAYWAKWTQEAPTAFKITFVNYDNTELWSGDVEVGVIPQYNGSEPKRESDDKYSYRFIGWDKELSEVTEITTYVAQFERTPIDYFVEYTDNGNALVGAPEAGEYDVIFAAYDLYNGLVGVKKVHTVFDDTGEKTVESENFSIDGAVKVKVMLWDSLDSMIPICKTAEKIITE